MQYYLQVNHKTTIISIPYLFGSSEFFVFNLHRFLLSMHTLVIALSSPLNIKRPLYYLQKRFL